MDNKHVRVQTMQRIHDLQEEHCKSCDILPQFKSTKDRNFACEGCPIKEQLQQLGDILLEKRKPTKDKEVTTKLTNDRYLLYLDSGYTHEDIAELFGRSKDWVEYKASRFKGGRRLKKQQEVYEPHKKVEKPAEEKEAAQNDRRMRNEIKRYKAKVNDLESELEEAKLDIEAFKRILGNYMK